MQVPPKVTVILPFYNAGIQLIVSVQSILNQSFTDFELLLIDNNSTDSSTETAIAFAKKDTRVNLIKEAKQGVVFALNAGILKARGKYIARMDADDYSFPDRLRLQADYLDQNPEVGLVSGKVVHTGVGKDEGFQVFVKWANQFNTPVEIALARFIESPVVHPSVMMRRELFDQYGMYRSGDFPEDYELWMRWLDRGVRFSKIPDCVIEWKDSQNRLSRTDARCNADAFYKVKAFYLHKWICTHVSDRRGIWIWGGGKLSRRRAGFLAEYGLKICGYFDVCPRKIKNSICLHFEQIPDPGSVFILSYVSNRGARDEIKKYLIERGYREGKDFLLAA